MRQLLMFKSQNKFANIGMYLQKWREACYRGFLMTIDNERYKRWIQLSFGIAGMLIRAEPKKTYYQFMMITIQGLGKLDAELVIRDRNILKCFNTKDSPNSPCYPGNVNEIAFAIYFSDTLTQSYLWVLGAYEVIRTISQVMKGSNALDTPFKKEVGEQIHQTKELFTRIRIPLAKYEPQGKKNEVDAPIAYPVLHFQHGTAWKVNENDVITRQQLSDEMVETFTIICNRK